MRYLIFLVILVGFVLAGPLSAQDGATESNAGDAGADEVAQAADAEGTGEDLTEVGEGDSPEYADDLNDFIPSREVPPDEQLTFPVDI